MACSKYPRSGRIARKDVTELSNTEVHGEGAAAAKDPTIDAPTVVPAAEVPSTIAPATPAPTRGTKRGRNDEGAEDEGGDEDAFYGRSAKKTKGKGGKGIGNIQKNDSRQKPKDNFNGNVIGTPAKAPETIPSGLGKRLKFDPEIHGVGLETRPPKLQEDMFEKLVSPRKKAGTRPKKGQGVAIPRKIAKPRSMKGKTPPKASGTGTRTQESAKIEGSLEPRIEESEHISDSQDKVVQHVPACKPISAPTSTSLTLEKRLQRLTSPTPTISKPAPVIRNVSSVRPRTFGTSFAGSLVKSSKPLTKPSFELSGDAHMRKRAAERKERKWMEEAEKQKEETKKQQQLHERFKTHTEQKSTKKDQQQGSSVKVSTVPRAPAATVVQTSYLPSTIPKDPVTSATETPATTISGPEPTQPPIPRRLTLDEIDQQLSKESELEEKRKVEEAVLRLRQEAAEKGKESARLWAEQMKAKSVKNWKTPGA